MDTEDIIGFPKNLPHEFRTHFAMMHNKIVELQEEVNYLRRMRFGRQSEKYIKEEAISLFGTLFDEAENLLQNTDDLFQNENLQSNETISNQENQLNNSDSSDVTEPKSKNTPRKNGGKKPFPSDLPREIRIHDLADKDKVCPHDWTTLKEIGEDVVEKIEIEPAQFKVIEHHYKKYSCPCCEQFLTRRKAELSILPSSMAEPGLFAHIVTNKFLYHLPLYRQENLFEQINIQIPRVTLARWVIAAADAVKPIVALIKNYILNNEVVHCDETPIQVLKGTQKPATSKSYMWAIASGINCHQGVYFQYYPNRTKSSALDLLKDFHGYLQVDGYDGYNSVCAIQKITRVGCFAHVRRKFEHALTIGANSGQSLANIFMEKIQKLFMNERQWKDLSPNDRFREREIHSMPILAQLRQLLDENIYKVPEKSKIGKAMNYMANEWIYLENIFKNGLISLSNNPIENAIRPFALGRKNWLFANTVHGAQSSAILYSLVGTAVKNNLQVEKYLAHLFSVLPQAKQNPQFNYEVFLPWNMGNEFKLSEPATQS